MAHADKENSFTHRAMPLFRKVPAAIRGSFKAKRIRLKLYTEGKALTNNEVIEMLNNLEEKKAETRDKGKTRQKSQAKKTVETVHSPDNSNEDTDHCFMCSAAYLDAEAREWVGCNKCYR